MPFNRIALLRDIFDPQKGEIVLVATDFPTGEIADNPQWRDRRALAVEWRESFAKLGRERGFETRPLLMYAATGLCNSDLPAKGEELGAEVSVDDVLKQCTLAVFMTEFSASAPLAMYCYNKEDFRAASLFGIERRMEEGALSADYREVARRCRLVAELLEGADSLDVRFSTGHECRFDLRFRRAEIFDDLLPRFKTGDRVITFCSGITSIMSYEGEKPKEPSRTEGALPLDVNGERVVLRVLANTIRRVEGDGTEAQRLNTYFTEDRGRANIAAVAFYCNDRAMVTGFHWSHGRTDHLGGSVGSGIFLKPENVVSRSFVYAKGNPIEIEDAVIVSGVGSKPVIRAGAYIIF